MSFLQLALQFSLKWGISYAYEKHFYFSAELFHEWNFDLILLNKRGINYFTIIDQDILQPPGLESVSSL